MEGGDGGSAKRLRRYLHSDVQVRIERGEGKTWRGRVG